MYQKQYNFKSGFEKSIWETLPHKKKGLDIQYESCKIPYKLPCPVKNYIPDIVVTFSNGKKIYIELKGYFRTTDKAKMKAVKLTNPDLDIRMVFTRKDKRYEKWCEKNKIPCAFSYVPKSWFKEQNK